MCLRKVNFSLFHLSKNSTCSLLFVRRTRASDSRKERKWEAEKKISSFLRVREVLPNGSGHTTGFFWTFGDRIFILSKASRLTEFRTLTKRHQIITYSTLYRSASLTRATVIWYLLSRPHEKLQKLSKHWGWNYITSQKIDRLLRQTFQLLSNLFFWKFLDKLFVCTLHTRRNFHLHLYFNCYKQQIFIVNKICVFFFWKERICKRNIEVHKRCANILHKESELFWIARNSDSRFFNRDFITR